MLVWAMLLGFIGLAGGTYVVVERRHRNNWVREMEYPVLEGASGYRDEERVARSYRGPVPNPRAPLVVRATALWSIACGQAVVPLTLFSFIVALFIGIGVVGIPGCILLAKMWSLGPALLRAEPGAIHRARSTAWFAVNLSVIRVVVVAFIFPTGIDAIEWALVGYSIASFVYAYGLFRVATSIEELWVARGHSIDALRSLRVPSRLLALPHRPTGA